MLNKFAIHLALFFGAGKFPKAPGTFATLAAIPLWAALALTGPIIYMLVTFILVPVGVWAASVYEGA